MLYSPPLLDAEAGASAATGSADLRRLADAGLVMRSGKGRNARYTPTAGLLEELGRATS